MSIEQERAELLPCPFCGESKNLIVQHCEGTIIHPAYRIYCDNCGGSNGYTDRADHVENWNRRAALQSQDREDAQPKLQVIVRSFPESNGRRNWTALLRREKPWDGLVGNCGGITLARGELWNRVAYEAERTKFLLGMRDTEPSILDYGNDVETPEQWTGEAIDQARRVEGDGK